MGVSVDDVSSWGMERVTTQTDRDRKKGLCATAQNRRPVDGCGCPAREVAEIQQRENTVER
jgi:hypothetical protein